MKMETAENNNNHPNIEYSGADNSINKPVDESQIVDLPFYLIRKTPGKAIFCPSLILFRKN
jgi:hypothetical protein